MVSFLRSAAGGAATAIDGCRGAGEAALRPDFPARDARPVENLIRFGSGGLVSTTSGAGAGAGTGTGAGAGACIGPRIAS